MRVHVKWYHSLRFKLFAILTALLTLAVGAFAINSGSQFTAVLNEQIRERVRGAAARSQAGVENQISQWRSISGAMVQNLFKMSPKDFQQQVEGFANSNTQIVAFDVYVVEPGKPPRAVGLGANASKDQTSLQAVDKKGLLKRVRAHEFKILGGLAKTKDKNLDRAELFNLTDAVKAPVFLIGSRFKNREGEVWALLTVLADGLTANMEGSNRSRTWVFKRDGTPLLWPVGKTSSEARTFAAGADAKRILRAGTLAGASYDGVTEAGEPLVTAYSPGQEYKLLAFVEQETGQEKRALYRRLGQFALLGFIVAWAALGIIYVAMGRATRSIIEAAYATLRIASGDLAARVKSLGRDEVGVLGAAVNHMAVQIARLLEVQAVAARQEAELRTAQAFQTTLFPKRIEGMSAFRVDGHYRSASECAGDWWSNYRLSPTRTLVLIADATGHGAPAALVGATAFGFFENYARSVMAGERPEQSPAALLQAFNEMLWDSGAGRSSMTMFLLLLDADRHELTYVNAGHVPCLFLPRDPSDERLSRKKRRKAKEAESEFGIDDATQPGTGTGTGSHSGHGAKADGSGAQLPVTEVPPGKRNAPLLGAGSVLGYGPDPKFEEKTLVLRPGDRFFLYTDGLTECVNAQGQALKPTRLREILGGLGELDGAALRDDFVVRMNTHFGDMSLDDDITIVVVETLAAPTAVEGAA
jgi:serine phosphatase RsbU (regulator of sigma subunit)